MKKNEESLSLETVSFFFSGILRPNPFNQEYDYFKTICRVVQRLFGNDINRNTFLFLITTIIVLNHKKELEWNDILKESYFCFREVGMTQMKLFLQDAFLFSSSLEINDHQEITVHTEEKNSLLKTCWELLVEKFAFTEESAVSCDQFSEYISLLLSYFGNPSLHKDPLPDLIQFLQSNTGESSIDATQNDIIYPSLWKKLFPTRQVACRVESDGLTGNVTSLFRDYHAGAPRIQTSSTDAFVFRLLAVFSDIGHRLLLYCLFLVFLFPNRGRSKYSLKNYASRILIWPISSTLSETIPISCSSPMLLPLWRGRIHNRLVTSFPASSLCWTGSSHTESTQMIFSSSSPNSSC